MWVFSLLRNVIFPTYFTITGSELYRVGSATEKAQVPTFVFILETNGRFELDDRSCLGCLAVVSSEYKYADCLDESD